MREDVPIQRLWTTKQTAQVLGIDRKGVFGLIAQGDLRPIRLSRGPRARLRFEVADVEALIENRKAAA
ncbi:MAG: helix-turn-helix domain-containing protein [Actinobacteria bacterium]|nr:helix-turn-helix domain-containing protein [Actinomycetota bacterium]